MKTLDTDILSLLFHNHPRVAERHPFSSDRISSK